MNWEFQEQEVNRMLSLAFIVAHEMEWVSYTVTIQKILEPSASYDLSTLLPNIRIPQGQTPIPDSDK